MTGDTEDRNADLAAEAELEAGFSAEDAKPPAVATEAPGPAASVTAKEPAVTEPEETPAAVEITTGEKPAATKTAPDAAAAATVTPPAKPKYVRLTEDEVADLRTKANKVTDLEKSVRSLEGGVGGIKSIVKKLQDETPKGQKVEIPAEAFAEMEKDFPELAAHMRKALEKSLTGLRGTGSQTDQKPLVSTDAAPGTSAEEINRLVEKQRIQDAVEALEDEYPDWREIVGASDKPDPDHPFRKWLNGEPKEYQDRVNNTNNARIILRAIEKYRASTEKPNATQEPPTAPAPAQTAARRDRIRDSAPFPKSAGGSPARTQKTPEQELEDGFAEG